MHIRNDSDRQPPFCVSAEIMFNRTSVGVLFNSSAPCPYPEGPCSCRNGSDGTSLHTCKPWGDQRFPFGSEFAFDTTGQEEVFVWARQESVLHLVRLEMSCALPCLSGIAVFRKGHSSLPHVSALDTLLGVQVAHPE